MRALLALPVRALSSSQLALLAERVLPHRDDGEIIDHKDETDPGATEVIKKISPFVVWKDKSKDADRYDDEYQGYAIRTNKQSIRLLISRWGQCCKKFGVYLNLNKTETQLSKKKDLIGAHLLSVRWGRDKPDGFKDNVFREYRGHACVDIHTDKGKVQLVAYNEHNGWYPQLGGCFLGLW